MGIAALAAIPEVVIPEVAAVSALPEIAAAAIPAALTAIPDLSLDLAVTAPAVASTAADIAGPLAASAIPAAATAAPSVLSDMLSNLNPVSSAEAATIPTNALPTATPLSDTAVHPGLTAASSLNPSPASITPTPGPAAAAPSAPSGVPTDPASTGGPFTAQDSLVQTTGLPTTTDTTTAPTLSDTTSTTTANPTAATASDPPGSQGSPSTGGPTSASDFSGKGATSLGSDAMDFLKKNPGAILSGGGALLSMLMQPKFPSIGSSIGPLSQQAANLNAQGSQLQSYLQSGQLPPGVQQGLDSASEAAKAAIRSKYAAMGGGAETSSAAVQDIANVDVVKETQGANIALSLLQQGVSETQLSSQLYTELLNATLQSDAALSSSIGNFASSLVPRTTVINTGSTTSS